MSPHCPAILVLWAAFVASVRGVPVVSLGACGYFDTTGDVLFHIMDFAAKVALEEGVLDDVVPRRESFTTTLNVVDTYCRSNVAREASSLVFGRGLAEGRIYSTETPVAPVIGISGCKCSTASLVTANLATSFGVSMVSPSATNPSLSDKTRYPYFARTVAPDSKQGAGIAALVVNFGWGIVQLIEVEEPYTEGVSNAFREALAAETGDVVVYRDTVVPMRLKAVADLATFDYTVLQQLADRVATSLPVRRVFVAPGQGFLVIPIVRAFAEAGLLNHATTWLFSEVACTMSHLMHITNLLPDLAAAAPEDPLFTSPSSMATWRAMPRELVGMLCLQPLARGPRYYSPRFYNFWTGLTRDKLLAAGMPPHFPTEEWWFTDMTKLDTEVFYPLTFDALTTLLVAVGNMIANGTNAEDVRGPAFAAAVRKAEFEGLSGRVVFDEAGDRRAPYEVRNLQEQDDMEVVTIGVYDGAAGIVTFEAPAVFADGTNNPPPDRPSPCPAGSQYMGVSLGCELCPPGRHAATSSSSKKCDACRPGFYAPEDGTITCLPAPPGSHAPGFGNEMYVQCPPGSHQDFGGSADCPLCHKGQFSGGNATKCTDCDVGRYAAAQGLEICNPCPIPGSTTLYPRAESLTQCGCPVGYHLAALGADQYECKPCSEGLLCLRHTLDPPLQAAGYHVGEPAALGEEPPFVVHCASEENCPAERPLGVCPPHRVGMACNFCEKGYYPNNKESCIPCRLARVMAPLIGIAVTIGVTFLFVCLYSQRRGLLGHSMTAAVTITCSLSFNAVQTFGSFNTLVIDWRSPTAETQGTMRDFALGVEFLNLSCLFSQTSSVWWYLIEELFHPFFAVILVFVFTTARWLGLHIRDSDLPNVQGTVLLIAYLRLSMSSLLPMQCSKNPDGTSAMQANRSVICFTDEHLVMLVMSMIGVLIYVVGVLSLIIWACIQYPLKVQHVGGVDFLLRFQWLFRRFTDERYYFCIFYVVRNLLVAAFPVLFVREPVAQVLLVIVAIVAYAACQMKMWPWRVRVANYLDMIFAGAAIMIMTGGCIMMDMSGVSVTVLRIVLMTAMMSCFLGAVLTMLHLLIRVLMPSKPYGVFLSHHRANAAVLARWFKLKFKQVSTDRVFYAMDDLTSLDSVFRIAAYETKNIIVLLTRETLWRMWCAGEITSGMLTGVHIILVKCDEAWTPPTDNNLEDLTFIWTERQQAELSRGGLTLAHVRQAYVKLRDLPVHRFVTLAPPTIWEEAMQDVLEDCKGLRLRDASILERISSFPSYISVSPTGGEGSINLSTNVQPYGSSMSRGYNMSQSVMSVTGTRSRSGRLSQGGSMSVSASRSRSGRLSRIREASAARKSPTILADHSSHESVTIAMVLHAYLQERLKIEIDIMDRDPGCWNKQLGRTNLAIVVLTHGMSEHKEVVDAMDVLLFMRIRLLPVLAHHDFREDGAEPRGLAPKSPRTPRHLDDEDAAEEEELAVQEASDQEEAASVTALSHPASPVDSDVDSEEREELQKSTQQGTFAFLRTHAVRFSPAACERVQEAELAEIVLKMPMVQMGSNSPTERISRYLPSRQKHHLSL